MKNPDSGLDYRSAARLIASRLRGHRARLAMATGLALGSAVCELLIAWALWRALVTVVSGQAEAAPLFGLTGVVVMAVVGQQALFGLATAVAHLVAFNVIASIRGDLGRAWTATPVGVLARRHSATAKNSAIDQCERLEVFLAHAIPESVASLTLWLAVTLWLLTVNAWLALATVVLVPVAFATMLRAIGSNGHRMGDYVRANAEMNTAIVDFLAAIPVVRAFNHVGAVHERTSTAIRRTADLQSAWGRAFLRWGSPFSTLVVSGVAVIVPVGTLLIMAGQVTPSELLLFFVLGPSYTLPLVKIFHRVIGLPVFAAGAREILDELSVAPAEQTSETIRLVPEVRFENVSFAYDPGRDVLHRVSFTIKPGTMTAVVGHSGSGKTTLAELLLGFHRPREGRISIGGRDVASLSEPELYAQIAAVFQRPYLHAGTLRHNITLACPGASPQRINDAVEAAGLTGVVMGLPEGLDTPLGEAGTGLSGGERQRVAIARAILADRHILVLDEVTAATDPATEAAIQHGLRRLLVGRTSLVIAHRLRTIVDADQIVVLDGGRVVEMGRHDDLVALGGRYARMWADHVAADSVALRPILVGRQ